MKKEFKIGDSVVRIDGGYTVGRIGEVIDVDLRFNRARVFWEKKVRTWVVFNSLELESTPYRIEHSAGKRGTVKRYIKLSGMTELEQKKAEVNRVFYRIDVKGSLPSYFAKDHNKTINSFKLPMYMYAQGNYQSLIVYATREELQPLLDYIYDADDSHYKNIGHDVLAHKFVDAYRQFKWFANTFEKELKEYNFNN